VWIYSLIAVFILVLALVIDLLLGEPPWKLHPTFWMGKLTMALESHFKNPNTTIERLSGVLLTLTVVSIVVVPVYFGLRFVYAAIGFFVYIIASAIIFKLSFCIKLETTCAVAAARAVESGDLMEGRKYVPYFSRRDEKDLTGPQIVSAIIESMAENLPDFKLSSIFYYAFLGVPGAVAVRAINTLDSVIGFKDSEHINTGWFCAVLDTIMNYIPARLSTLLIVLAAAILGEDWKGAWKIAHRDRSRITSINHGWPIAAMAGALSIQLEKPGYFIVGDKNEDPSPSHITRALKIRNVSIILCVILMLPILLLTHLYLFPY
jgi:adenosylcobinamide-phosphate synthase